MTVFWQVKTSFVKSKVKWALFKETSTFRFWRMTTCYVSDAFYHKVDEKLTVSVTMTNHLAVFQSVMSQSIVHKYLSVFCASMLSICHKTDWRRAVSVMKYFTDRWGAEPKPILSLLYRRALSIVSVRGRNNCLALSQRTLSVFVCLSPSVPYTLSLLASSDERCIRA